MTYLNRAHRAAIICGATPLLIGTAIFIVWVMTRWDWLMIAGAVILFAGLTIVAAGGIALAVSCWMAFRTPGVSRRHVCFSALNCAGLLLSNVLAARWIIVAVISIATRYTVVVQNTSDQRLDGVRVLGGGCDASYGSLPPGASARRSFWIQHDGVLVFRASVGHDALEQTIDEYVTGGGGGNVGITVQPDQTIAVTHKAPRQLSLFDRARDTMFWLDRSPCQRFAGQSSNQMPANIAMEPTHHRRWLGLAGVHGSSR